METNGLDLTGLDVLVEALHDMRRLAGASTLDYAFVRTDLLIDSTTVQVQWCDGDPRIGVVSGDDSDELEW